MILHRIEVANVGPFTGEPVSVGPFASGLNILTAPNETGKTTLLKAAGRGLFDRHTCKDAEMFKLQPAGTDLAPRVVVEFETGAGRFRAEKTFLQAPRSLLSEYAGGGWKPVAEADAADARLTEILQSSKPGKGATKAAHWGLLGYLWMRQGELAAWPEWTGNPAGQTVQSLLVKVEIDPFIESVRERMWTAYLDNFTPTGQQRAGGELRRAEAELARVETALARIAEDRQRLAADEAEYARLGEELPRLEAEHADHRRAADALQEAARRAEIVEWEVRGRRHEFDTAQDRLRAVRRDVAALETHRRELDDTRRQLATAEADAARSEKEAADAQARLAEADRAHEAGGEELARLQAAVARAGKRVRHRQLSEGVERLARTVERCREQAAQVESLARQRAEVPSVSAAELRQLEKLEAAIRDKRAQIEARGLTVELTPTSACDGIRAKIDDSVEQTLPPIAPGGRQVVHAARGLALELPGWGRLRMRSGADEARTLEETMNRDEAALRTALAAFGVSTLPEARALAERGTRLDAHLAAARQSLAAVLDRGETADGLRTRAAAETRQLRALEAELALSADEPFPSLAELEAAEQTASVQHEHRRAARETIQRQLKKAREAAAEAAARHGQAERAILALRLGAENLEKQAAALHGRYSDGIQPALDTAEIAFVEAKVHLKQSQEKLPPDAATLGERNRRAAAAAEQVRNELERKRRARDEIRGRLEWLGSQALYTRETDLLAEHALFTAQADHARARSRAARLIHDLIERRKQAATRTVLGPLQERLGARFAEVSGQRDRQIFLDESLNVQGLGRKPDELVAFDELSQGAREQLLLCLRLAVAEELAATAGNGPQSLILDDVLVNTDADRQRRVLDVLCDAAAGGLQIIVFTCHPDRYRGIGNLIELARP